MARDLKRAGSGHARLSSGRIDVLGRGKEWRGRRGECVGVPDSGPAAEYSYPRTGYSPYRWIVGVSDPSVSRKKA
jgi:hypothetical protein